MIFLGSAGRAKLSLGILFSVGSMSREARLDRTAERGTATFKEMSVLFTGLSVFSSNLSTLELEDFSCCSETMLPEPLTRLVGKLIFDISGRADTGLLTADSLSEEFPS